MNSLNQRRSKMSLFTIMLVLVLLKVANVVWAVELTVGYLAGTVSWGPLVARDKGFFTDQGIDAEMVLIRGAPTAIQAQTAGQIDLFAGGTFPSLMAYLQGAPLVAVAGLIDKSPSQIYSVPGIKSVQELKGRRFATGAIGGPIHYESAEILRAFGLDLRKDVEPIFVAGPQARFAALERREVAASLFSPPFTVQAEKLGFKKIGDVKELIPENQFAVITVSLPFLQRHPDRVRKAIKALVNAMGFIRTNRRETVTPFLTKYYGGQSPAAVDEAYDFVSLASNEKINVKGLAGMVRYAKEWGIIKEAKSLGGYVDLRFIE